MGFQWKSLKVCQSTDDNKPKEATIQTFVVDGNDFRKSVFNNIIVEPPNMFLFPQEEMPQKPDH